MKKTLLPTLLCFAKALREGKKGAILTSVFMKGFPLLELRSQPMVVFRVGVCLFLICVIPSCKKENRWDCIKRTGEQTTDTRTLPPFTKIYLKDNIDVFITQGAVQEVKIESGKNLTSLIKTKVIDGELRISNDNKCNWARSYKKGTIEVYITLPTLIRIEHDGSGQVKSQNTIMCDVINIQTKESGDVELSLHANTTFLQCLGSSDITLHGTSSNLGIYHVSEGYLYCEDFPVDVMWGGSYSSGNEYLNVKLSLGVTIGWVGNIYFTGNPSTIETKGKGQGKLIHQN
ncbi:MAG: DUF2807 domain-containing protein [Bacteroidetes bacterium]|nr:DUF2807 domain-containing protein [Bacteroidota bacterium]